MKIGLKILGGLEWIGGVNYIRHLVKAISICNLDQDPKYTPSIHLVHNKGADLSLFEDLRTEVAEFIEIPEPKRLTWIERGARRLGFKARVSDRKALAEATFLKENGFTFVYPYQKPPSSLPGLAVGGWIPDFQHRHLPEMFKSDELAARDRGCEELASSADVVVLSSQSAQRDFAEFLPEHSSKGQVLRFRSIIEAQHLQADPRLTSKKYKLSEPFFLVSNQLWKHKNHLMVIEAARLLRERGTEVSLVFTGHLFDYRDVSYINQVLQVISEYGLTGSIHILGVLPKFEQIQLMRASTAMIQPSLFEGWSSIVEDGRALGKSLILSDLDVHHEQSPPRCKFFPRHSPEILAELMASQLAAGTGYDPGLESIAVAQSAEDVKAFGQKFLEIARGCAKAKNKCPA